MSASSGAGGEQLRIAVFLGGTSEERDVSLASGSQIMRGLREIGHRVIAVDPARGVLSDKEERKVSDDVGSLPASRAEDDLLRGGDFMGLLGSPMLENLDVIFIALHGGIGEDGTIQAILDLTGIPYTGSGHIGSALAMDKEVSKHLFRAAGVPTPEWIMAPAGAEEVEAALGFPVIVKASKQGSTVGLTMVKDPSDLEDAIELGFQYDDEVIIERFVPGRELTVGILGEEALPPGEIIPEHEIFDYECKYQPGMAEEIFPADLTDDESGAVRDLGLKAHRALKLGVYSRVDFRMDAEGGLWCLEANTNPGMTSASLLPRAAEAAGYSFPDFCDRICRIAIREHRQRARG